MEKASTSLDERGFPSAKPSRKATNARASSPLWDRALEKYREELGDENDDDVLASAGSLEDLVAYAGTLEPSGSNAFKALGSFDRALKFVDDFSAVVAICLGANAKVTALVWGSLRLIITLASGVDEALQKALEMLEELSLSLPRLRYYEENLRLERAFENALLDLYGETICFYARLIRYYKVNPHLPMQHAGWQSFQKDFASTMRRVKHLSATVEKEADLIKMRLEQQKYEEVLEALKGLGDRPASDHDVKHYRHIPASTNSRCKAEEADLRLIREALAPSESSSRLRTFALYGMGGVGKTQLALRYALNSKATFETILWIAADTRMSLDQSFGDAAIGLGLMQDTNHGQNEKSATARVKDWLLDQGNGHNWLVVFDNADDISILQRVWPANGLGSVLVTSRDFKAASITALNGTHLQPFGKEAGAHTLLRLLQIANPTDSQRSEAEKISDTLGGLPLALDQVAAFMTQRKLRLEDFWSLYERHAPKIDARSYGNNDYPHTIATVFDMALTNLSGSALELQNLLGFLEPDSIPERIFEDGCHLVHDPDFEFLADEMDLGDAEEMLLQTALVNRDRDSKVLSVHRLVQSSILRRLDDTEKRKYFDVAMSLLGLGFPDTWSKDIGHQKKEWTRCEMYLPHVNALVRTADKKPSLTAQPDAWAELLLRCSWYLYEKEQYSYARTFIQTALTSFTTKDTIAYASAVDLLGLIHLDMNRPREALASFERGLSIRQNLLSPSDPLIAFALNNLALAYTEMSDLSKAEELHRQAIEVRLQNNSDRIGNSYSNFAVTLLRQGRADDAEKTLMQCPSLQGCTDDTFLQADNPRFVGDMVLLSRIRLAQGRRDDALRLASKALTWRQQVHGDRFKTCDSMFDVACLLHDEGQSATALDLLMRLRKIADCLDAGEGQAARAEWKASRILADMQRDEQSREHEKTALALRKIFRPDEGDIVDEKSWHGLAPYMLW